MSEYERAAVIRHLANPRDPIWDGVSRCELCGAVVTWSTEAVHVRFHNDIERRLGKSELLDFADRGDGTFYAPVAGYYRMPIFNPPAAPRSCPTRLMDGRNEIRCWLNEGREGECR